MPEAATVTIPGVEIVKAGTWAASTGPVAVTTDDIADAIAASRDPEVDKGPLRFGHTGALSNLGDSTPAFGWLDNLTASDDGTTIIGDLVDVPAKLAPVIKAAFKRRSAELAWGVKTVGGKTYRMVIDGLALLGTQPPAVKGMADLAALYDPATPPVALATSKLAADSHSTLSIDEDAVTISLGGRVATIDELIEHLTSAMDSRGLLAGAPHAVPVPALAAPPASGGTMPEPTLTPEQLLDARTKLGLADDSTDEQVVAKLSELDSLVTAMKPPVEPSAPPAPVQEPAALSAATLEQLKAAGLTVVPTDVLAQVQAGAEAGAEARTLLAAQARDDILDAAYQAGKLGAGDTATTVRARLSAQLDTDFDGTKALIDVLPAIVPVGELGAADTGTSHDALAAATQDAAWDAELRKLFGNEIPTPAKEA